MIPQRCPLEAVFSEYTEKGVRDIIRDLYSAQDAKGEGPGPGHIRNIIAPAAQGYPGYPKGAHLLHHRAKAFCRQHQMGQGVRGHRVHPKLRHKDIRFIGLNQRRDNLVKTPDKYAIPCPRIEGEVHRVACSLSFPGLLYKSCPREEEFPAFMERYREDFIRMIEGMLDPISMMGIDINVGNPFPLF